MEHDTRVRRALLVSASVVAVASGCTPQLTQTEIKMLETREMDLPYEQAYQAAANGLFSLGYTIDHSDKESGVLTGRRHDPKTGAKIASGILFGVIGLLATSDAGIDEAATFMVTQLEPELTQLRMKLVVNGKPVIDRTTMSKIWQQIEREAMLESRPSDRGPASQPTTAREGP